MNKRMKIAIPIVAAVVAIGSGAGLVAAWSEGKNESAPGPRFAGFDAPAYGAAASFHPAGPGFRGFPGVAHEVTLGRIATLLGTTVADLKTQLQAGKTLADLAKAKGVSQEKLVQTILAPHSDVLDVLVKYGYVTKEQAAARLQLAQQRVDKMITSNLNPPGDRLGKGPGRPGPRARMMVPGGMWGR